MGQYSDDLIVGACCSFCMTYFENDHGYPVLCINCFDDSTEEERCEMQRATEKELGEEWKILTLDLKEEG